MERSWMVVAGSTIFIVVLCLGLISCGGKPLSELGPAKFAGSDK